MKTFKEIDGDKKPNGQIARKLKKMKTVRQRRRRVFH